MILKDKEAVRAETCDHSESNESAQMSLRLQTNTGPVYPLKQTSLPESTHRDKYLPLLLITFDFINKLVRKRRQSEE